MLISEAAIAAVRCDSPETDLALIQVAPSTVCRAPTGADFWNFLHDRSLAYWNGAFRDRRLSVKGNGPARQVLVTPRMLDPHKGRIWFASAQILPGMQVHSSALAQGIFGQRPVNADERFGAMRNPKLQSLDKMILKGMPKPVRKHTIPNAQ